MKVRTHDEECGFMQMIGWKEKEKTLLVDPEEIDFLKECREVK